VMRFDADVQRGQEASVHARRILLMRLADERISCARSLILCERK
jgi:hypothetical protein